MASSRTVSCLNTCAGDAFTLHTHTSMHACVCVLLLWWLLPSVTIVGIWKFPISTANSRLTESDTINIPTRHVAARGTLSKGQARARFVEKNCSSWWRPALLINIIIDVTVWYPCDPAFHQTKGSLFTVFQWASSKSTRVSTRPTPTDSSHVWAVLAPCVNKPWILHAQNSSFVS